MQVLFDFTPSDAVNGPVSARKCCTRATNFFAESLSSDMHHMQLLSCLFLTKSTLVCGSSCCSNSRLDRFPRKRTSWLYCTVAPDCSECTLHLVTLGWFAGSERPSSCSRYWFITTRSSRVIGPADRELTDRVAARVGLHHSPNFITSHRKCPFLS
jgi:hypothetical protein